MVHTIVDGPFAEEKELKRLVTLEYRVYELENCLLKEATAALEKRVQELETSLKASNEECHKLREALTQQHQGKSMQAVDEGEDATETSEDKKVDDNAKTENTSDCAANSDVDDKDDGTYERVLTTIEKMRQQCIRAINLKIPTSSRLPKNMFGMRNTTTHKGTSSASTSPTKMPVRSRTPSCPSITPVSSRPGTPPYTVPSSPLSATASGIPMNTAIPLKSTSIPVRNNSRPTTPIPSSPLCSPVQVGTALPTLENAELPPLRSIAIPVRKGSNGYSSSMPGTPMSSSPLASPSASSPLYQQQLSSSPPLNGHGYAHAAISDHAPHKRIPLRSRASSYSLSNSRPSSPFRAATMHSLFHPEKTASVQN
jgi:hypothetical protein